MQRPSCGQCIRNGLPYYTYSLFFFGPSSDYCHRCEGYDRQWTFVESDPGSAQNSTVVALRKASRNSSPPLKFLPDGMNRTAFEAKSLSLFWSLYLPKSGSVSSGIRSLGMRYPNFTDIVPTLNLNDTALRPALLALCLSRIGENNKDLPLVEQGIKFYGTALRQMKIALEDQQRIRSNEIIAACKLLAVYEVCDRRCSLGLRRRLTLADVSGLS